ncbi:MAG TPA: HD domain-containing phosphohydrolase, partial [Kofleriaceae bacterium]|nr:HD domain-containing phosphohydrolase [Kofleriaceae bacterium]
MLDDEDSVDVAMGPPPLAIELDASNSIEHLLAVLDAVRQRGVGESRADTRIRCMRTCPHDREQQQSTSQLHDARHRRGGSFEKPWVRFPSRRRTSTVHNPAVRAYNRHVRLGELLGALSLATDLAIGCPLETTLRTCVLATRFARELGLSTVTDVRRVALLRHLGCTAYAHEAGRLAAGNDQDVLAAFAGVDHGLRAVAGRALSRLAREEPIGKRIGSVVGVMSRPRARVELASAQCDQAVALALDLQMSGDIARALGQIYERFDGLGVPNGVAGDELAISTRVLHV